MKQFLSLVAILLFFLAKTPFAQSAEILFISNINGVVKNCGCGDPSLGGIPRIITLVNEERKKKPDIVMIDGGDFFNPYSYPDLNHAVSEQFTLLRPDILTPGDQETVEGIPFFKKYTSACAKTILGSNLSAPHIQFKPYVRLKKGMIVLSYLDKSSFDLIKKPSDLKIVKKRFEELYSKYSGSNRIIILFHGTEQALAVFTEQHPQADLILWGHAQSDRIDIKAHPAIVAGGTDGAYLMKVNLNFKDPGTPVSVEKIPIGVNIPPDADALNIIKKWHIH